MSQCVSIAFILLTAVGISHGDVLGIHGFVRLGNSLSLTDNAQIELTQVKMELLSMNGNRLMETDCAPNGYFFIPVPKAGKYILKAKGSQGWSFTPAQKQIECGSQQCQSGMDVVFSVEGFSIKGKIQTLQVEGCNREMSLNSIMMQLQPINSDQFSQVQCSEDGSFSFDGIMPGKYVVTTNHEYWNLIGPEQGHVITTGWESVKIDSVFTVAGFTLTGSVEWNGGPMKDIMVSLFGPQGNYNINSKAKSDIEVPTGVSSSLSADLKLLLSLKTDLEGNFMFENVPCGSFVVIPWLQSPNGDSLYEFDPPFQESKVPFGDLVLPQKFKVSSFLVTGKLLHKVMNNGVQRAEVLVNGQISGMTNEDGDYKLYANVGTALNLEFRKESILFPPLSNIKTNPFENTIPPAFPDSYAVCGSVIGDSGQNEASFSLKLTTSSDSIEIKETDTQGNFCFWLEPGSYTLEVSDSVVFAPKSRRVKVVDSPLSNLKFVQKRVSLRTSITKMNDAEWSPDLQLILQSIDQGLEPTASYLKLKDLEETNGVLIGVFKDILPGEYKLEVICDGWCWQVAEKRIQVSDDDIEVPSFIQIGFEKQFLLSHDAKLTFTGTGVEYIKNGFYSGGKVHSLCFASPSIHYVNAEKEGCFVFNEDMAINPTDSATLAISAFGFKTQGSIQLPVEINPSEISIKVISKTTGQQQEITPMSSESVHNQHLVFEFIGSLGEEVEITPRHWSLIFQPPNQHYSHSGASCAPKLPPFIGKEGIFVKGIIQPIVEDAEVELWLNDVVVGEIITSKNGSFSFGPFYEDTDAHHLLVEKSGYEFSIKKSSNPHFFLVEATRLVKVEVSIQQMKKKDKSGVLVTTTGIGKGYRSNAQTNEDGVVSFWKLPVDSYYIKPMLKEYEFTPSFHQIKVDGNKDEFVSFVATRTGFSAHGIVVSLNNNLLTDVTVLAAAEDSEESCVSDKKGRFHLQNLKPDLKYTIKILTLAPIRKSWPDTMTVTVPYDSQYKEYQDIKDLKFVVYKDDGKVTISGSVEMDDKTKMNSTEVKILKMAKSDGTLHIVSTIRPYINGWFEKDLAYPGKYQIRVVNKQLDAKCKLPNVDVVLDGASPRKVSIGELRVECEDASMKENVDYEDVSRWPVLLTILAIIVVPFRAQLRELFVSGN